MECSQVKAILFEYTDTEIPVEFREDVEGHLAVCGSCARQLEALREQSYALRTLPRVEAPRDFLEQVRSRLEKPSLLSRLMRQLPVLFARRHFFQLAGVAATAVVVIATAQVMLRDSGRKALLSPAPPSVEAPSLVEAPPPVGSSPSVEAPPPVGSSRSFEAPAAPPARPESLPDISSKNRKALNGGSPAGKPHPPLGIQAQSVSLTLRLPGASPRRKSRTGAVKPDSFSAASPAAGMRAPDERRLRQDATAGAGGLEEASKGSPSLETEKILPEVRQLISRANGKILSAGPARDENRPATLLAEIPAANYPSFLDQLRQLGEVDFNGNKEFSPAPDAKVRVSVSFDARD
jgi:hypothetical protein